MDTLPEKANVLVVDDRPDKLLALQTMLEPLGQNLVCVRSGDEALRELLRGDFAVILLDVNMPRMDGFETASIIRGRQRSEATPIIFISAVNDDVVRGYSLGAVDYILTPIIPEILRAKVAVFVELFQKTAQIKRQAEEHARFAEEKAARVEAEAGQERFAFLAEASRVLGGSLDLEKTFENLANLLVPRLGNCCIVHQVSGDTGLRQVAVAHRVPEVRQMLRDETELPRGESRHPAARVIESGLPEIKNHMDQAKLAALFSEEDAGALAILLPGAYMAIPISARGTMLGSITVLRTGEDASYTDSDMLLGAEIARRTALALENASLYRAAQSAREEAESANRAKDRFLAMLSHELRTPLTPVITSIVNLEADASTPPSVRRSLLVMRRNVELEARLIDDLLDLTRVAEGKIHLSIETVNVHSLIRNAMEICQADMEAKGLSYEVHLDAADFHVKGDPARLQQIFWNLIRNAVKFTHQGRVTLHTRNDGGRFHLEVKDTGIGMDSALLARIFQPFEQGEEGKYGGLGLGLAITKGLVDVTGGRIEARSGGPGHGSTFALEFSTEEPPPEPAPVREGSRKTSGNSLRILLLEDHVDTNESLTMLLQLSGYSVVSALNVRSAIELASNHEIDVLISDLGLPDGNASQALDAVVSRYDGAVGIALSGFGMDDDRRSTRESGFSHHLVKPVEVSRLTALLGEIEAGLATTKAP